MSDYFDTIVIGAGPGGYVAALRAAQLGRRTLLVERDALGGRCLNYACIPAKVVLRSADVFDEVVGSGEFGIDAQSAVVNFPNVAKRRARVIKTLTGGVSGMLKRGGVEVITAEARLGEPQSVLLGARRLTAGAIILATGSRTSGIANLILGGRVIDTQRAWTLDELPQSLVVVGAGSSGVEVASGFARLGTSVTLLEVHDRPLPAEDVEMSRIVSRALTKQGVDLRLGTSPGSAQDDATRVVVNVGDDELICDWLVLAIGRVPDVDSLGLNEAGIALNAAGLVDVDGRLRTSVDGIWAIGDLTAGPAFAHKASGEALIAVEDAAGLPTRALNLALIPRVTFSSPSVASFGLTEAQAVEAGHDVTVGKVSYGAVGAGAVLGDRGGLIKLIGDRRYGEIVGAHIVGARSTELISELVTAASLEGGYPELARVVHGHPTLSEGLVEAARAAEGWQSND